MNSIFSNRTNHVDITEHNANKINLTEISMFKNLVQKQVFNTHEILKAF